MPVWDTKAPDLLLLQLQVPQVKVLRELEHLQEKEDVH